MATDNVVTIPFRLAFPEVFAPKAAPGSDRAKYSITMVFPKDGTPLLPNFPGPGASILDIRKLAYTAAVEKWGTDASKWPVNLRAIDVKTHLSPPGRTAGPSGTGTWWSGMGSLAWCLSARIAIQARHGGRQAPGRNLAGPDFRWAHLQSPDQRFCLRPADESGGVHWPFKFSDSQG